MDETDEELESDGQWSDEGEEAEGEEESGEECREGMSMNWSAELPQGVGTASPTSVRGDDGQSRTKETLDEFGFRSLRDTGLQEALQHRELPHKFDEIGESRYRALCRSLRVTPIQRFFRELNEGVVNLKFYGLSPRSMRAISDALMYNPSVHTLDLTGNWLSSSACYYLSELLLRENNALRTVILRHCNLRAEGAALLAEGLELNQSTRVLDLAHNKIGDQGMRALQNALSQNGELQDLDLSCNELGAEAAAVLAKAMRENTCLVALRLARNNLYENTPKGLRLLLRVLQGRENLQLLDLAWNALNQDAAVPLRAFLRNSPSIQQMYLDHNRFPGSAVDIIKTGIVKSVCLEHISLGCNPIEPDNAMKLLRACQASQSMRVLELEGIRVSREFLELKGRLEEQRQMNISVEGALDDFEITGPNLEEMMLKRARYEGLKPKKKKKKKDFGHLLLEMARDNIETLVPDQFTQMAHKKKIKVREELLHALYERFARPKRAVDVSAMLKMYMKLFPETELPPSCPKKEKKKKKKRKIKKSKGKK